MKWTFFFYQKLLLSFSLSKASKKSKAPNKLFFSKWTFTIKSFKWAFQALNFKKAFFNQKLQMSFFLSKTFFFWAFSAEELQMNFFSSEAFSIQSLKSFQLTLKLHQLIQHRLRDIKLLVHLLLNWMIFMTRLCLLMHHQRGLRRAKALLLKLKMHFLHMNGRWVSWWIHFLHYNFYNLICFEYFAHKNATLSFLLSYFCGIFDLFVCDFSHFSSL